MSPIAEVAGAAFDSHERELRRDHYTAPFDLHETVRSRAVSFSHAPKSRWIATTLHAGCR